MMQFIRNNTRGVIAWIIVILLIIPFALWGVNEYFYGGGGDVAVAKVGDREILSREFLPVYQRELALRRQASEGSFDPSDPSIRREVLDRLVNAEVMSRAAFNAGIRIDDARVAQQIRGMQEFRTDGRFDPVLYERLLRVSGLSASMFEENMRRDLMIEQLIIGVAGTTLLTGHDVERWLSLSEQERRFGFMTLEAADWLDRVEIADDDIARFYRENIERFAVPEQVRAEYLELSLDGLRAGVSVDEATLRRQYEERSSMFSVGEERRVRHILIELDPQADAETAALALETATELRERIVQGESFETLAREFSDDSGSAAEGGDLGLLSRGAMPGEFEEAVFALGEGDVGAPVRTAFGIHLIRVDEIRPGTSRSFEEVREQLADELRNARADEQFFELTELLADLAFENPDTLVVAAEELGLEPQKTGYFSRDSGEGIASEADFRNAAFLDDVLEAGNNSPLVEYGTGKVVVLRVLDRQPASHRPLDEVSATIERELRQQRAAGMAADAGRRIIERIRGGEAPEEVAGESGLEWRSDVRAGRDDFALSFDLLGAVFAMSTPGADGPRIGGAELSGGDFAVIALHEVIDGDPAEIPGEERRREREAIAGLLQQRDADDMLRSFRDRLGVRVFEDRLQPQQ